LMQRHLGEIVRFAVRAPEAKKVMLLGISTPIAATRDGDTWQVQLPLAAGRYFWAWQIDGHTFLPGPGSDSTRYGVRTVYPRQPVPSARP
ncbi:MAG TPA: hypothetical protein VFW98_12595, partial [Gemmatimonadaceae bacterium]|nr:hypothetical protein [Gemmatimonadaceae bacterium]